MNPRRVNVASPRRTIDATPETERPSERDVDEHGASPEAAVRVWGYVPDADELRARGLR